jgi:hypothetical protein
MNDKKWYHLFITNRAGDAPDPAGAAGAQSDRAAPSRPAAARHPVEPDEPRRVAEVAARVPAEATFAEPLGPEASFGEIYSAADIRLPGHGYTILKVAEMLESAHIRDLPPEVKRKSVLVALEAAGVKVTDVIEDAIRRDRALDTWERVQQKALDELEAELAAANVRIQEEMARLMAEHQSRLKANEESLRKERTRVQAWRTRKMAEEQRIADAVGYFTSENPVTISGAPKPPGGA